MIELNAATKWRGWGGCMHMAGMGSRCCEDDRTWPTIALSLTSCKQAWQQPWRQRVQHLLCRDHWFRGAVDVPSMQFRSTCAMHADKTWAYSFEQWLPWVQGDNDTTSCRSSATSPRFKGIVCYACKYNIEEGTPCRTCPAPRHYCQAHWHTDCTLHYDRASNTFSAMGSCPACSLNSYEALCIRRS